RITLPVAIVVGGAIAIKPATQLMLALPKLLAVVPQGALDLPTSWLPQIQAGGFGVTLPQIVVLGAMLLGAAALGIRLLED
ncbi:MAG: hypothetical protein OEM25_07285, partial [Gammaproteobacteria bacterium]|nr:hypothetical protein [Gammaproteobacteria bacterium]